MRLLCVAAFRSNHSDRHVTLLAEAGHDVHLALTDPVTFARREDLHPGVTLHRRAQAQELAHLPRPKDPGLNIEAELLAAADRALPSGGADRAATWLADLIDDLRPDVVHSFSIHQSSFLTLIARSRCQRGFPHWIASNWGCDLHYFGQHPAYKTAITLTLKNVDGYFAECARDDRVARELGLRAPTIAIQPIGGGFDLEWFRALRTPGPTSGRRLILLKGYQSELGRALVALQAIRRLGSRLQGHRVAVYGYNAGIVEAVDQLRDEGVVDITVLPFLPYEDLMRWQGQARCSIGLSISDGICTSAVEAMLMGSVPIQSDSSCLGEWTDTASVLLVPATDVDAVEAALVRALDDSFVDQAAERNDRSLQTRFSPEVVNPKILAMYEHPGAR